MKDRIPEVCHSERSEESPLRRDRDTFSRESYFCESYKRFFDYATPRFMQIAAQINAGTMVRTQPFI